MTFRFYTHPSFLNHDTGPGHPECPARLESILEIFNKAPFDTLDIVTAREGENEEIARAHSQSYIDTTEAKMPEEGLAYADQDTVISPGTWEAAMHAVGAVCQAVDDIASGDIDRAFCAVRPPGHHAQPENSEGFCLFNNIFIGARHAQEAHNIKKIAILDFDVHHGNGTDAMTRLHDNIFFASTHQGGIYPGTGTKESSIKGCIENVPLNDGEGSSEFRRAWKDTILPALDEFEPDLIMISAGFDAHADDPLACINLSNDDFSWITDEFIKVANKHCGGKIISVLEGGYNLTVLKENTASHIAALAELSI